MIFYEKNRRLFLSYFGWNCVPLRLMKKILFKIPPFVATVIVVGIVAYLTLFPDPVTEMRVMMFPYADKVVHFLMFFGVAACLMLDCGRVCRRIAVPLAVAVSVAYGGLIELLQMWMAMGRAADWLDFAADAVGAVVGMLVCRRMFFR